MFHYLQCLRPALEERIMGGAERKDRLLLR